MSTLLSLTSAELKRAAAIKDEIAGLEKEFAAIVGKPGAARKSAVKPAKRKGGMSAAGRARVAAAQRARWAKVKAAKKA
jgi:hypothetical protein